MDTVSTGEERKTHSFPPRDPRLILAEEEGTPVPTHTVIPSNRTRRIRPEWTVPLADPEYQEIHEEIQRRKHRFIDTRNSGYVAAYCRSNWYYDPEALERYQELCIKYWELLYLDTYWKYDDFAILKAYAEDVFPDHLGIAWHIHKVPKDIEATASLIQSYIPPDLSEDQQRDWVTLENIIKEREFEFIEKHLHLCGFDFNVLFVDDPQYKDFIPTYLQRESNNEDDEFQGKHYTFVVALVCKLRHVTATRYRNFPDIDQLRQILINRYYQQGRTQGNPPTIQGTWQNGTATPIPFHPDYEEEVD